MNQDFQASNPYLVKSFIYVKLIYHFKTHCLHFYYNHSSYLKDIHHWSNPHNPLKDSEHTPTRQGPVMSKSGPRNNSRPLADYSKVVS